MPRGGRRKGSPATSYPQRTDLNKPLPVAAPTGLPYGENQALSNAQRTIPMAPAPTPAAGPPPAPGGGSGGPAAPPAPLPVPGANPLFRPTERPNEPVTAGLASGPGAGPEALGSFGQGVGENMAQMLGAAAQAAGSPTLGFLARQASAQGQ